MIIKAILKINPDAMVTVVGDNIDTCEITWHDGTTPISKDDIKAQLPTALNIALDDIRIQRNGLIKDTDYLALSDQTLSSDMTNYRQALRDITNGLDTVEKCNNVTWPTKP